MIRIFIAGVCLLALTACTSRRGTGVGEPSAAPGINDRYKTDEGRAASVKIFEAEARVKYQRPDEVVRNLSLKSGDVVCEVGAGSGYFTPVLSKAVGSSGTVYAEDPQPEFLEAIRQKKVSRGLTNVEIVLT